MNLLALDTSSDACSAALCVAGVWSERLEPAARRHGELILPMIEGLLAEAGIGLGALDALAFARGPGSFTGVRIAVSVAQGLAFGAGLPTVPVSTLAGLAQGEHRRLGRTRVLAALDARMGEVYWAACTLGADGVMEVSGEEGVYPPAEVPIPAGGDWWGVGPGWAVYADALTQRAGVIAGMSPEAGCSARDLGEIAAVEVQAGRLTPAEGALPVYLRDRVTHQR